MKRPELQDGAETAAQRLQLKAEAMTALRKGRFDLADELLARGDVTLGELTHNLRVYQAELEAQAQELRESQQRTERVAQSFRRLFEALPQAALVTDRLGVVVRCNGEADRLFGLAGAQVIKPALRRIAADAEARHALHNGLADAERQGRARLRGISLMYRDGQSRRGDLYIDRLDDPEADSGVRLLVLVVDESERIAAAETLAQTNLALRQQQRDNRSLATVARSTRSMVLMTDPYRRITWANQSYVELSGYSVDELVGRTTDSLHGPGTDEATATLMLTHFQRGEGFTGIEVLNYAKNGEPFWVMLDVQPVRGDDGALEGFVSVQVDVTERHHTDALLRESEAYQRAIFDATPALVAVLQRDGRIANLNAAGLAMLQLADLKMATGQPLQTFLGERDVDSFQRLHARAMLGEERTATVELLGRDGRRTAVELHTGPLWRHGSVQRVVAIGRDITAERALGALRTQKEAAEAASQAKSRFLSQMSHELRTPLNAVLGFTQLMQVDLANGQLSVDTQRSRLAMVEQAGWHLLSMIDDVLDLSRIESGRMDLHLEAVLVVDALRDALALVQNAADRRSLHLVTVCEPAGLRVLADPVRLKQVLANLLSNAVKYNSEGGRVELRAEQTAGEVRVSVQDTGRGLRPEEIEHLFEPFNRLSAPSTVEGSGIGLVIVRHLLQAMAGRIEVHSVPGEGSEFVMYLPQPQDASVPGVDLPMPDGAMLVQRCNVLYIEDVESNIELMHQALAGSPWKLQVERTGLLGLEAARQSPPDLILLDLQLPDIDGIEVRRRLLADAATRAVPCVAVTADGAARATETMDVAFDGWLDKPLRIPTMQRVMAQVVGARHGAP